MTGRDPERIFLEPRCCADPERGRTWATDAVGFPCDCGASPAEYVRADIVAEVHRQLRDLRARVAAL